MVHAKLCHEFALTIVWVLIIAAISGIKAVSLVSTSPVTATATANPVSQLNSTGNVAIRIKCYAHLKWHHLCLSLFYRYFFS